MPRSWSWPEPRALDFELLDAEKLSYKDYVVLRLYKTVRVDDFSVPERRTVADVDVSYAILTRKGKVLASFDDGIYHPMGNGTKFGVFPLLGTDTRQLVVAQTIWRGGQHWIVSLSPRSRVIYSSGEWNVGTETISAIDLDHDGVDEILEAVTAFYDFQDKLAISQIPVPTAVFKYDAKAGKYFPANTLHRDYLLKDIEAKKRAISRPARDKFDHLAGVLDITLQLIYAGDKEEGWEFFDKAYQLNDKQEIRARVQADLNDDRIYRFIYGNRKPAQIAPIALPEKMSAALDRKFPGWEYAPVEEEIWRFLRESVSPFARPDIISGDFDGNGLTDYAVLITQRVARENPNKDHETNFHLIVFLSLGDRFKMHVIDPDGGYLSLMRRGEWDYDYETQANFTYQNDAIFTGIFEKGGTSYVYEKGQFRAIITSD